MTIPHPIDRLPFLLRHRRSNQPWFTPCSARRSATACSARRSSSVHLQGSRRTGVLDTEVMSQGQLDFGKLVSIEEVDGVANDVADVDRPDLVDQHLRDSTPDLQLGAVDRGPSRTRGGDDRDD